MPLMEKSYVFEVQLHSLRRETLLGSKISSKGSLPVYSCVTTNHLSHIMCHDVNIAICGVRDLLKKKGVRKKLTRVPYLEASIALPRRGLHKYTESRSISIGRKNTFKCSFRRLLTSDAFFENFGIDRIYPKCVPS